MNKYLEKIAEQHGLEKEAVWGMAGRAISRLGTMAAGGAKEIRKAPKKSFSNKMHQFGQDVIKGKGYARAALGGGVAATGLGAYAVAKD